MNFCNICDNMYYIKLNEKMKDADEIIYYCRNCGNSNNDLIDMGKCILKENISKNDSKYSIKINKYTKLDKTLPRINNIKCPNENCESNLQDFDITKREIIYIRYDHINMKYVYLCNHCDYVWKTEK